MRGGRHWISAQVDNGAVKEATRAERIFKIFISVAALAFTVVFCWLIIPPQLQNPDPIGGFAAGFVNPYASGYSTDVVICWFILTAWIIYEARTLKIRHGWICALLGIVPGVAVGFALYLLMRMKQLNERVV